MRSNIVLAAFAALAIAAPRPQEIEFDLVDSAADPIIFTPPTDVPFENIAAISAEFIAQVVAVSVTEAAQAIPKRGLQRRDGDCSPEAAGTGPRVSSPDDTPEAFLAYELFKTNAINAATKANVPQGYSLAFSNLEASSRTSSYLGFKTLSKYDPIECASVCDQHPDCMAFNLYYERDPSIKPNAVDCPNPTSVTNVKCVRWGVPITKFTAKNNGEHRNSFKIVISGSNGYNKDAPPATQSGFKGPVKLGGAINAPNDPVTDTNTYMGYKFFSFDQVGTFASGVAACTAACTAQTGHNSRHPPKAPAKPSVCNQAIVYLLSQNNQPQGIYCAMYSEEWAQKYATNYGQYRGSEFWSVSSAYAYTNESFAASYGPICALGGCPNGSYKGGNCGGYGGTC
ncbi:uncharacterized protein RSE6_04259 [Rhynchosporium secalis]|uniref:Uncharacterized protein n=1 Tax=Rhynchosporium secalis TaxID=38038 RepID=A0A1E1M4W6_RHYSE|nr:uncharacterized protein RSE6_04259 [Rhynchosporium secalis]